MSWSINAMLTKAQYQEFPHEPAIIPPALNNSWYSKMHMGTSNDFDDPLFFGSCKYQLGRKAPNICQNGALTSLN